MNPAAIAVDPVGKLLTQLTNVRQHGQGWRADCPVGHTSRGSLSVARGEDGRVLMHCFASCDSAAILGALGMSVGGLFVQTDRRDMPAAERGEVWRHVKEAGWAAALGVLAREATVIEVAAAMIGRSEPLAPEDIERVHVASQRIHDAQDVLR